MWKHLLVSDAVSLGKLEVEVQLTPWSVEQVRETLAQGAIGWGFWSEDKVLLAYLLLQPAPGTADILTLGVHTDYRRQGLGQQLLEQAQCWAIEREIETLFLEVRASNTAAINLYEMCGFKTVHRRAHYYNVPGQSGVREDAWIMVWQNSVIGRK